MMIVELLQKKRVRQWLFYIVLSFIILAPTLRSGYILDIETTFKLATDNPVSSNTYLVFNVLRALNAILSAEFLLRLLLFFTLLISGVGMHRFIEQKTYIRKIKKSSRAKLDVVRIYGQTKILDGLKNDPSVPAYFAGILYVMNPFTYQGWVHGDYLFLAGYALLPWLLRSMFNFVNRPDWKGSLRLALYYTAVAMFSVHVLVLATIAGLVAVFVHALSAPSKMKYLEESMWSNVFLVLWFAVINSFWLNSVIRGTSTVNDTLNTAKINQLDSLVITSLLASALPLLILFVLAAVGVKRRLRDDRPQAITFLLLGALGFLMAAGILKDFSEPRTFASFLVLSFSYFGAYGLQVLAEKAATQKDSILNYIPIALLILPIALTPAMLWGFGGRI